MDNVETYEARDPMIIDQHKDDVVPEVTIKLNVYQFLGQMKYSMSPCINSISKKNTTT
jgi:hypothetical protein